MIQPVQDINIILFAKMSAEEPQKASLACKGARNRVSGRLENDCRRASWHLTCGPIPKSMMNHIWLQGHPIGEVNGQSSGESRQAPQARLERKRAEGLANSRECVAATLGRRGFAGAARLSNGLVETQGATASDGTFTQVEDNPGQIVAYH